MRERTRAKLDPLGSGESRTLWVLLAGSTGVYATVMTIAHWTVTPNPGFAIAGTGLAVLAAALTIWWTAPRRSPFTGRRHVGIHITALLAMAATLWAQNHATFDVGDAYPVFIITGLVVAMSPYRPPTELVAVGVTSTVIAGFLVLIRVLGSDTTLPALVLAVIAVSPILALTAAAATYTETILRTIERARHSRQIPTASDTEAPPDRVTAMTRDTLPLLQRILKTGTITRADRVAAIRAAAVLRATLVAEVNRTWLDAT
ncbi:MAG TPA: hypothetical protein PK781_08230, partial [Terrimesophilobacter sp.]|nr:hypothetical protein [Terrimesophilobacter sp.]